MNTEQTVKCKICGKPYKFYMFYAGDQSACPACRREAEDAINRPSSPEETDRRKKYFGNK